MKTQRHPLRRRQRGFSLIDAMIAMLVAAFGMLAIAGFQITLARNSDIAKQRSEAVRLAQQKMEELRSFETVESDASKFDYTNEVASGNDVVDSTSVNGSYNTNASYTRNWFVRRNDGITTSGPTDAEKWIRVEVSWADRAGETQVVRLQSVISRSDPISLGTLATGPGGTKTRQPKDRNLDIPYPAVNIGGGKSGFQPPGAGNYFFVFDNVTGEVTNYCAGTPTLGFDLSACQARAAYLLSGYIRFLTSIPSGANADEGISNPTVQTKALSVMVVDTASPPVQISGSDCYAQRQKVVAQNAVTSKGISGLTRSSGYATVLTGSGNNGFSVGQSIIIAGAVDDTFNGPFVLTAVTNGSVSYYQPSYSDASFNVSSLSSGGTVELQQQFTIAESETPPSGYNTVLSRFVAYSCIVPYTTTTSSTTPPVTTSEWSGRLVVLPGTDASTTAWALGTTSSTFRVCRFSGDYVADDSMSNSEHPLYYRQVTAALDNQNYLILPGNIACPTDSEPNPLAQDYINVNTLVHQTSDASPYGGGVVSTGTQWPTTPEPSSASTVLPMF